MTPLEAAIATLGSTLEQVSSKLRDLGIKGYRRDVRECPIANYFKACGFTSIQVGVYYILQFKNDKVIESYSLFEITKLPKVVGDWIIEFDNDNENYSEFLQSK